MKEALHGWGGNLVSTVLVLQPCKPECDPKERQRSCAW